MSNVVIIKNDNIYNATLRAIEQLDVDLKGDVLIKPNLTLDVSKYRRACTNPEVIKALIDIVRKHGGEPYVGESSMVGCDTLNAFEKSGLKEVCDEKKVQFIDFNRCQPVKISVDGSFIKEIVVAQELYKFEKIISVPVMKTHVLTGVSLGLKNMKGIQYKNEKIKLHEKGMRMLHVGIVDINMVFKPYLTVIDGSYAQEGEGPVGGNVVKMDLVVASTDVVAADATACRIMEINPFKIDHIKIAGEKNLGSINDNVIFGESVHAVKRKFKYPKSGFKRIKYWFFDLGMNFAASLQKTTEGERAYKITMNLIKTEPRISTQCKKCRACITICPHNAINYEFKIDYKRCKSCMICMEACPHHAITSKEISILKAAKDISICIVRVFAKAITGRLYKSKSDATK